MLYEIILIRHGETFYNEAGRIQGSLNSDLNSKGENQAEQTGQMLNKYYKNIDSWFVSPQGRARQTSKIMRGAMPEIALPEETIHNNLREIECGEWEGKLHTEVDQDLLQEIRRSASRAYPGGESMDDLLQRSLSFIEDWKRAVPVGAEQHRSVVVAHGNLVRALSAAILDLPVEFSMRSLAHNCAMHRFLARDRSFYFRLAGYNLQSHLHDGNALPLL